ncbi:Uncharacterised protein [Mycobacteroides abscessus subsp. abscessus]|nr:Uncharacterised protein [Mycobacteroides abscessus subsp. abscessus]
MSGLLRLLGLLPGLLTWNLLGRLRTTAVVYRDAIVLIQRRLVVATLVIRHRAGHLRWLGRVWSSTTFAPPTAMATIAASADARRKPADIAQRSFMTMDTTAPFS